ncbi:hypothetical protein BH10ACT1_BH10ACT1_43140 [soil metagenome]
MSRFSSSGPVERLGQRRRVDEDAQISVVRPQRFRARDATRPVRIVEASISGASLQIEAGFELGLHEVVNLGIDDQWGRVRVTWSQSGIGGVLVCGVEFLDAEPAFLPTVASWLDRTTPAT